ncbi:uncharacterized protein RSE6_07334 [Rhynchosporium secalis]|uniref:Uncharacterized protein n=1 Tax=Rhynchosporium secalis TaxID=38038 RepID=A0A1E1MCR8_RHYSE|nr:uncharacterized protein RSE6_07334 [Rhynchosporium secalis]
MSQTADERVLLLSFKAFSRDRDTVGAPCRTWQDSSSSRSP